MNVIQRDDMTPIETHYNEIVTSTRSLIERVIGVWKVRFRCVLGERKLRYDQTKASKIIITCATLHNYLISNGFDIMHDIGGEYLRAEINNNNNDHNNHNLNIQVDRNDGLIRRDVILGWLAQH